MGKLGVHACPAFIGMDRGCRCTIRENVEIKASVYAPRDAKQQFNAGEAHQAEVVTGVKIRNAGKCLADLSASSHHGHDGQGCERIEYLARCTDNDKMLTAVNCRDQPNDHGPAVHQGERNWCIVSHRIAANVLKDIETMALNYVFWGDKSEHEYPDKVDIVNEQTENHFQERDSNTNE